MAVMKVVMKMISKTREMKSLLRKGPRGCHLDKKKRKKCSRACFEFRVLVVRRKKKVCVLSEQKQLIQQFFCLLSIAEKVSNKL